MSSQNKLLGIFLYVQLAHVVAQMDPTKQYSETDSCTFTHFGQGGQFFRLTVWSWATIDHDLYQIHSPIIILQNLKPHFCHLMRAKFHGFFSLQYINHAFLRCPSAIVSSFVCTFVAQLLTSRTANHVFANNYKTGWCIVNIKQN